MANGTNQQDLINFEGDIKALEGEIVALLKEAVQ
jgi:hypothetical protein